LTLNGDENRQSKSNPFTRTRDRDTAQRGNAGSGKELEKTQTCCRQDPSSAGLRCRGRTVSNLQAGRRLHQPLPDDLGDPLPQLGDDIACALRRDRCYERAHIGRRFAAQEEPSNPEQTRKACAQTFWQELNSPTCSLQLYKSENFCNTTSTKVRGSNVRQLRVLSPSQRHLWPQQRQNGATGIRIVFINPSS
jgi:hypothetical protein